MIRAEIIDAIAQACHRNNALVKYVTGDTMPGGAWGEESRELRESVRQGVEGVLNGNSPRELHESWLAFKHEHGWVYGDVKDEKAKTHPCILPYDELPLEQQIKDTVFKRTVHALKPLLDYAEDAS